MHVSPPNIVRRTLVLGRILPTRFEWDPIRETEGDYIRSPHHLAGIPALPLVVHFERGVLRDAEVYASTVRGLGVAII